MGSNEEGEHRNFFFQREAVVITQVTAMISTVSSGLILAFVFCCDRRCFSSSNIYHRIMSFMSAFDIITSIAMLFTTIPMPADVNDTYNFATGSSGSKGACSAQGFVIVIGGTLAILFNSALSLFYIGSLHVGMTSGKINKRMLYPLFGLGAVFNIAIAVLLLRLDLLNPQPLEPFCFVGSYPMGCNDNEDTDCIGGASSSNQRQSILITAALYLGICVSVMATSFALVIYKLHKISLAITALTKTITNNENVNDPQLSSSDIALVEDSSEEGGSDKTSSVAVVRVTPPLTVVEVANADGVEEHLKGLKTLRSALCHGIMYIIALFLTWTWVFIDLRPRRLASESTSWPAFDHLKMIFLPLHGFLNALIFFYQKIWLIRQDYYNDNQHATPLGLIDGIKRMILSPTDTPPLPDLRSIVQDIAGVSALQRQREFRNLPSAELSSSGDNAIPYDGTASSSGALICPDSAPSAEVRPIVNSSPPPPNSTRVPTPPSDNNHPQQKISIRIPHNDSSANTITPPDATDQKPASCSADRAIPIPEGVATVPPTISPYEVGRKGFCSLPAESSLEEHSRSSFTPPLDDRKIAASDERSSFGVAWTTHSTSQVKDDKKTIGLSDDNGGSPEVVRGTSSTLRDENNRNATAAPISNKFIFKIEETPAIQKLFHTSLLQDQFSAKKKSKAQRRPVQRHGSIGSGKTPAVNSSTIAITSSSNASSNNLVENNAVNVAGDSPVSDLSNNPTQSETSDLELDVDPELNEEEEESDEE